MKYVMGVVEVFYWTRDSDLNEQFKRESILDT